MRINQHTKISEIIKHNAESINAIASIAPTFQKLRNPILRKLLAPRVNIAEAAKIGKCNISDFKSVLIPIGYQWEEDSDMNPSAIVHEIPAWLSIPSIDITVLDVRPILDTGKDPLKDITKAYNLIEDQGILCIVNTFIPYPLIHKLEEKGALSYVEEINKDEIKTYFFKNNHTKLDESLEEQIIYIPFNTYQKKLAFWQEDRIVNADVRLLPMPEPMETILALLKTLQDNQVLAVKHKKIPLYLLEELSDQNYKIYICQKEENDIRILIHSLKK